MFHCERCGEEVPSQLEEEHLDECIDFWPDESENDTLWLTDAEILASAGWGTDEDYGVFDSYPDDF